MALKKVCRDSVYMLEIIVTNDELTNIYMKSSFMKGMFLYERNVPL